MSATGSVRGFSELDDLVRGDKPGYSHSLVKLFDVDADNKDIRHFIPFREASDRLIKACDGVLLDLKINNKQLEEFVIGKSFVKRRTGVTFRPDRPTTWSLGGGVNGRWRDYFNRDYYGLVVLGCVERELIPTKTKGLGFSYEVTEKKDNNETVNKSKRFKVDQQLYALALEQSLIHHYMFVKPDKRLRNHSLDCGGKSEESGYQGGVVYVAFKVKDDENDEEDRYVEENVSLFF